MYMLRSWLLQHQLSVSPKLGIEGVRAVCGSMPCHRMRVLYPVPASPRVLAAVRNAKWAPSVLDLPTDKPLQLFAGGKDHGIGVAQGAIAAGIPVFVQLKLSVICIGEAQACSWRYINNQPCGRLNICHLQALADAS